MSAGPWASERPLVVLTPGSGIPLSPGAGHGNGRSLRERMGVVRDFKRLIYPCTLRR